MFRIEERDIRFNVFEWLKVENLLKLSKFKHLDLDTVEMLLLNGFKMAKEVIAPIDAPGDKEGCKLIDGKVTTPKGYKKAYDAYVGDGWLGISSPVELGGTGAPAAVGIPANEAIVSASSAFAMYPGLSHGNMALLIDEGSPEQKAMFVEKMMSGKWGGTMCLTEAGAGSAVGDLKTTGVKISGREGFYKITGQKIFISSGEHDMVENNIHLVLARTPGAPSGIKGISLFIVPKYRVNPDGSLGKFNDVVCAGIEHKMGIKGSATCTMSFGDNNDCEGWIVGKEGDGIRIMFHMMNEARLGVALQGLAVAAAAYNAALDYARERVQGVDMRNFKDPDAPRVTIINHPDVRRMLMIQRAYVHGVRALIYKGMQAMDLSLFAEDPEVKEKAQNMLDFLTPIAKGYGTDAALEVTRLAMQTLGGYGYISEYPLEQYMRDARIFCIYEGTNGIQAMDLVGRKMASKGGMVFMSFLGDLNAYVEKAKENPALAGSLAEIEKSVADVQEIAGYFLNKNIEGDVLYVLQYATPFLKFMGNLTLAWLLGDQALVAHEKLQALFKAKGITTDEAKAAAIQSNEEMAYYDAKVKTAVFFNINMLPENRYLAQTMISGDKTLLDVTL
jgi:alkylation response protein AidB-like acyl-CoA dehydrogenase